MTLNSKKNRFIIALSIAIILSSCLSAQPECVQPTAIISYSGPEEISADKIIVVSNASSGNLSKVIGWDIDGGELVEENGDFIKIRPDQNDDVVAITLTASDCEVDSEAQLQISILPEPTNTATPTQEPVPKATWTSSPEPTATATQTVTPEPTLMQTFTATPFATSTATTLPTPIIVAEPTSALPFYPPITLLPASIIGDKVMFSWKGVNGGLPEGYFYAVRVGLVGGYESSQTWTRETHFELTVGNEYFPDNQEYSWHVVVILDQDRDGTGANGGWVPASNPPTSLTFYVNDVGPGGPPPTNTPIP